MGALRELFITLGLDWDSAGFAQALAAEKLLEKAAHMVVEALKEIPKALAEIVTSTAEYGEATENAAVRTGLTTTAFQELSYAAATSGSSVETFETALTRLARKMFEARAGSTEAMEAFSKLGVRVTDGQGRLRDREQVLLDVADALQKIKNPTEQAAAALKVFDRSGVSLLPLISKGSKGIEEMRAEARRLGNVMDEAAIKKAAEFNHMLEAAHFTFKGLIHDVGGPLIEALMPVVEGLKEWFIENRELIRTRLHQVVAGLVAVAKALWATLKGIAAVIDFLIVNWKFLAVVLGAYVIAKFVILNALLLEQLVAWALNTAAAVLYGATSVAAAVKATLAWVAAAAPLVLITALLVALVLIAEDIYVAFTGGDSMLGRLATKWMKFTADYMREAGTDPWWLTAIKRAVYWSQDLYGLWEKMSTGSLLGILAPLAAGNPMGALGGVAGAVFGTESGGSSPSSAAKVSHGVRRGGGAGWQGAPYPFSGPSTFNAPITINASPGMSAHDVGNVVREELDDWWGTKVVEAAAAARGG